jgi:uncharacterized protein YbaR (Trm112 family)
VTKKKRPKSARTLRRTHERDHDKLALARRKLLALEAGGSPGHPIVVPSAAVIEARAESVPCPDCQGALRVSEHEAHTHDGELLREVTLSCRSCGAALRLFFRIMVARPN